MTNPSDRELAVFSDVRRLPPGQRAAYLDKACEGDAALRQRVEELLQASEAAGAFLEKPASGSGGTVRDTAVPSEKAGDRIGRYKLLQQIGEGGCGVVYMAEQEEPVRRRVALKVIKLGMDTKSVIARFEAERQALAQMDHPNIAKVLEAGASEAGRPYFVMELVRGVKITDYCNENSLSTVARLELFIQVCQAIQHAHQKGIIHRDIKPSNILVTDHDGKPVPKIIDFGIAKATTDQRLTDKTLFTAFAQFIGTPAYMSPEQARLNGLDIDTRSDIYSLGVLLYELLMGKTPFASDRLLEAGLDEIRRIIREDEPLRPSTRLQALDAAEQTTVARHRQTDPPKLAHLIRGDLDWIVMKCLEKDRGRRYETANGLAADIQRHLKNEPVAARPPSELYRIQKLVRRNKLAFIAASVVIAALIIGLVVSMWMFFKEQQARQQAEAERQIAKTEASKSREVAQFLEDMLNGIGPSVAQGLDTALLRKVLDNTAKRVGTGLGKQPEVEAELRYTLGEVYWQLGDLTNAEAMHREALIIRTNVLGNKDPQTAQSMRRLAHVLWRLGRLDEADKMASAGLTMQRELFGSTNLEVADSLEDLSAIYNTERRLDEAEKALRESLATKEALLGHDNLEVADVLQDLAAILARKGQATEAETLNREALGIRTKLLGSENPQVIIFSLTIHATELESQKKFGEEEITLNELVARQRKLIGNEHPDLAQSLNHLATILRNEGELAQSEATRREALEMQRKVLGGQNVDVAQTLSGLGDVLTDENRLSEAESMYRESLQMKEKLFGSDGVDLGMGSALFNLGEVLEKEGKLEEARNLYLQKTNGTSNLAATAQYRLAMMYQAGKGVERDSVESAKWMRKSADLGYRGAQCMMGIYYADGTGVPKDDVEAARWYRLAADRGHGMAQNNLGWVYQQGTGVPKDEVEAERWYRKSADQGNVSAMINLANLDGASGRSSEAIVLLEKACEADPNNTDTSLTLAIWQTWFGHDADYEATRRRLVQQAEGTDQASTAERAVKACCLRSSTNTVLLEDALNLAWRAMELGKNDQWLPYYQLGLGLAEYRNGQYAAAERDLATTEEATGGYLDVQRIARPFHAMSLFRQGKVEEARKLISQAEQQMPPLPQDENKPLVDGKLASHDLLICWLAYKETKALFAGPALDVKAKAN